MNTTFTHNNTEATLLFARDVITMSQTWLLLTVLEAASSRSRDLSFGFSHGLSSWLAGGCFPSDSHPAFSPYAIHLLGLLDIHIASSSKNTHQVG